MAKSALLDKKEEAAERPKYSPEEEEYLEALRKRMEAARDQRDKQYDEWDGMDYVTQYEANERAANTYVQPKQNREDTNFQSGIIRQKLFALLSAINNLNLTGDISAYDKDGLEIQGLGDAMEDVIAKANELDGDDEKKFLRQYELLKHGTVFVEETWQERSRTAKKLKKPFSGKVSGASWDAKIEKAFSRPSRAIIPGPNVYLGDMTVYDASDQPFLFTVDVKPYDEAKRTFGEWERWKNVPKSLKEFSPENAGGGYAYNWHLFKDLGEGQVEILRYQDKWNNEFAVILNGVLMTPVGLPLPFGLDEYTVAQQNLEPIHAKFSYGKSLVARVKNKAALLDEMMRLAVLKTQKSFMPPYINLSGRTLSSRVLMPGKISYGIPKDSLVPISDKEAQGVSSAELSMIREVQESIDAETTSPVFSGQQAKGSATATEIIELQRQAKMMLGLSVFSVATLEWKLEWLRLKNVINNWFKEENRGPEKTVSVERAVEGEGTGRRIIVPTKSMPPPEAVMAAEDALSREQGVPVRLVFIDPDKLKLPKLLWQIAVRPKEKKSSETEKLLFRAEMQDAQLFGPLLNLDYLADRFASVWNENPRKMFRRQQEVAPPVPAQPPQGDAMSPRTALPTAEKALGREVRVGLGATA